MNPHSDNFEQLRKLLALKRHEQPPPGYFENLSNRILSRLEAAGSDRQTWWQRLGFGFEFKPAFVCALGVIVCGLFCVGVISTLQATNANAISAAQLAFDTQASLPMISGPEENRSSIEPVVSQASAFDHFQPRAERASYTPGR